MSPNFVFLAGAPDPKEPVLQSWAEKKRPLGRENLICHSKEVSAQDCRSDRPGSPQVKFIFLDRKHASMQQTGIKGPFHSTHTGANKEAGRPVRMLLTIQVTDDGLNRVVAMPVM